MHGNLKNLTGKIFGRLVVLNLADRDKFGHAMWNCDCECGLRVITSSSSLLRGLTKSCGCLKTELFTKRVTTHGMRHSPEYSVWCGIKERCNNPNAECYARYGGRGISICPRWQNSFEAFFEDMGPRPTPNHSVERKDNAKGYDPSNCRWATRVEQGQNKRNNILISARGLTKTAAAWGRITGIKQATIYYRIHNGWTAERAITGAKTFKKITA